MISKITSYKKTRTGGLKTYKPNKGGRLRILGKFGQRFLYVIVANQKVCLEEMKESINYFWVLAD